MLISADGRVVAAASEKSFLITRTPKSSVLILIHPY